VLAGTSQNGCAAGDSGSVTSFTSLPSRAEPSTDRQLRQDLAQVRYQARARPHQALAALARAEHETRDEIVGLYRRVWEHTDATINSLAIDAPGYVPWWRADVKLFNIMVHVLSDTTRHAGHADILREQLDGAVGMFPQSAAQHGRDSAFWETRRATIEQAARAADPAGVPSQPR
jgi:hypothetical protein